MGISNTVSARGDSRRPVATGAERVLRRFALAAGLAIAVALPAHAAPTLVNGGFESGDFTGWTGTGDTTFNGVQCPGPGPSVFQGNCSAFFGPVGTTGGITQTVTSLVVGTDYVISFAFQPDGGTPSSFSATFGGLPLINLANPPGSFLGPFQVLSFTRQATATSEALAFNFRDDPGFISLDAVSISVAVPEPATLAMLGIGFVGLWIGRRRRQQLFHSKTDPSK
jgi:hypothetical protein